MLKIEGLSKSFGEIKAVDDITFEIADGEIFGLLGPNGAGKTTTISMVAGLLQPDSGKITVNSIELATNPRKVKKIMGVVPQDMAFYEELSARENLAFWARLQGLRGKEADRQINYYLEKTGLMARAGDPLKKYSGGMKRRINLIIGLLHQPRLLLLDEPTIGIDVQTRLNIYGLIREASAKGTTILYTTHNMKEAEELCHRMAIMDDGRILASGTLQELIQIVGENDIAFISGNFSAPQAQKIVGHFSQEEVLALEDKKVVLALQASRNIPSLLEKFFKEGISVNEVTIKQPSLESVFLKLTGKELRE
ncbi:MAG: ABC transporter ATP-binding protein [Candidatus Aminicenantales bacterium]